MIITKSINGNRFTFICESKSDRIAFHHECKLYCTRDNSISDSGTEICNNRCQYYNRTWESYQFQSIMKGLVYNIIAEQQKKIKDRFKRDKGLTRLSKKADREHLNELIASNPFIIDLQELVGEL